MQNRSTILRLSIILLVITFPQNLISAPNIGEMDVQVVVRNDTAAPLLVGSIGFELANGNINRCFIGNIRPGEAITFCVAGLRNGEISDLAAVVDSRITVFLPEEADFGRKLKEWTTVLSISEARRLKLMKSTDLAKTTCRAVTPILNLDIGELTMDVFPEPLDVGVVEHRLTTLRSTPLTISYLQGFDFNDGSVAAYTNAYIHGWYASALGDLTKIPLPLVSLWGSSERFEPKEKALPKRSSESYVGFDPFTSPPPKDKNQQQTSPQADKFQTMIEEAFKSGNVAGLKAIRDGEVNASRATK